MASQPPSSAIEITAKFFPLAFILFLFPPTFVVDGQAMKGKWRTPTTIPVAAGSHSVKVFFRYLFIMDAGKGDAQVDVAEGAVRRVAYKAPWLVFLKGRMTVA
jgi:hypothetical protein